MGQKSKSRLDCRDGVLHYSTRPNSGPGQILKGNDIDRDPPIQAQDPQLLGQIDHLEAGTLAGWACSKGQLLKPLEVRLLLKSVLLKDKLTHWLCTMRISQVEAVEDSCVKVSTKACTWNELTVSLSHRQRARPDAIHVGAKMGMISTFAETIQNWK